MLRTPVLFFLAGCATSVATPPPEVAPGQGQGCLGSADAPIKLVYLHGMDGESPSLQERSNRVTLRRLADHLGARIALPRAPQECPDRPHSRCWGWTFDAPEIEAAAPVIEASARACFGDARYGLIGFSNGGYLLDRMVQACLLGKLLPGADWVLTMGAARGYVPPDSQLTGCGRLALMVASHDSANTDHAYFEALLAAGAQVSWIEVQGIHLLPGEPLEDWIRRFGQHP